MLSGPRDNFVMSYAELKNVQLYDLFDGTRFKYHLFLRGLSRRRDQLACARVRNRRRHFSHPYIRATVSQCEKISRTTMIDTLIN
jgi:hypothetical protein